MDAHFDFKNQLITLQQLYLTEDEISFKQRLAALEFQYYTQPVLFAQLLDCTFNLLHRPQSCYLSITAELYYFVYNNFIVLNKQQLNDILILAEADYPSEQRHFVQWCIAELLGIKFANKESLLVVLHLQRKVWDQQRQLIPYMLEQHIGNASSIAVKKQALNHLKTLVNDNHRPTRSEAQASLKRVEKQLNPRIYRSIS